MTSSPRPLSDHQYIRSKGLRCPFCRARDVEGQAGLDIDAGVAPQEVRCNACQRFWTDIYLLAGYQAASD
ncbi:hypothetical protein RM530_14700 [Algiphilus sp. W345]|uniref:Uncharacterized protein n=1 Tax=Banduia mediterranea TaxID=3075609 RepID=A0ABU2WNC2_9GAMM|nr:hypothetical protein [Algiphilus sp. W345]MDT0498597.1 hypothetical protein [Algiphilus sp. W345]